MKEKRRTNFIPMLAIPKGTMDIEFYKNAFGATELRRWNNEDDSIHVAELCIDNARFHLREENLAAWTFSPVACNGITAIIGLQVNDVDNIMKRAVAAGAREISKAQNYDHGYRQGTVADPFGHHWLIETIL